MNPHDLFDNPDMAYFCAPNVEGQCFERKLQREPKELAKTLSGFANAQGGLLVIGISKYLKPIGVNQLGEEFMAKMLGAAQMVKTLVNHRMFDIIDTQGQPNRLILMYVEPVTDRVVSCADDKAFMRRGDKTQELTTSEILQLMQQRSGNPTEDRPIVEYDPKLLDDEVVGWLLEKAKENLTVSQSTLELLQNLSLVIDKNGQHLLTVAGYLLLAKNPRHLIPGAYVRYLKYQGTEQKVGSQQNLVKDETFVGPLPKIVLRLRDFIPSQLREFTYYGPDGEFRTEPEYPASVWDEAVVNALFHRSYGNGFKNEPVFVRVFDDRMEIVSPGAFPEGIGPGHFRHDPRNPHVMTAMRYFAKVQMIGEGTKRMYHDMAEIGLPEPEFAEPGHAGVQVVLRNDLKRRMAARGVAETGVSTQFTNLFPLNLIAPKLTDEVVLDNTLAPPSFGEIKEALIQVLRNKGWMVDSFTQDVAVNYSDEYVIDALRRSQLASLYPGFTFRILKFDNSYYLCLDHTVEVRNRATVARILEIAPYMEKHIVGNGFARLASGKWQPCRIQKLVSGSKVEVVRADREQELVELYPTTAVIPNLKTFHVAELIRMAKVPVDLHKEIKKLALNLAENAARERARKTTRIAETLSTQIFPLRVRAYEIVLSPTPQKLEPSLFRALADLRETEPVFYKDLAEPIVVEGLTKHGAFGRPSQGQELALYALCTHDAWPKLQQLIEAVRKGSMRYQGFERTFGLRLGSPVPLLTGTIEEYKDELNRALPNIKMDAFFIVYAPEESYSRADYRAPYYQVKYMLLQSGYPSQMVDSDTLADVRFKDLNLALNIFAKAGYTPWVLAEGMPEADLFVGLSYSSIPVDGKLERVMAYVNVFDAFGRWQYYRGNYKVVPFEQRLNVFRELVRDVATEYQAHQHLRYLHIHVPFKLSYAARQQVASGAYDVVPDAEISFVYINRHALVRAYDESPKGDGSLPRGTYVYTTPNQFWLATTGANALKEKVRGTPRILEVSVNRLNAKGPLDLRIYAQHIFSLTKLNWASSRAFCHEPITIKYASDIAYLMNVFVSTFGSFQLHPHLERKPWFL